ncbi:MAG TPA: methylated-DNA--[protein]-cysteine S-methyltransferase [Hanamia sp.]|nr:methylated-DNA--[protein]-cysteine S-methyltransferase [Hanamia sp.]
MEEQQKIDFERIASAIDYIKINFKSQPTLEQVAAQVFLSPHHFQRMFTRWAGTSPKKFLQYISVEYAKSLLSENKKTLFDTSIESGLSGSSRLHDLFISIEGMTPGEYKNGGENLNINYDFFQSHFGKIIVASTNKGICHLAFTDDEQIAVQALIKRFPNALFQKKADNLQKKAAGIFSADWNNLPLIKLHLKGSEFQLKVWEALLKIPVGKLTTYGKIAGDIKMPKASRAVGTAVGANPVAWLIPCHRVIQSSGIFGGYHWGTARKAAIIGWEAAKINEGDSRYGEN